MERNDYRLYLWAKSPLRILELHPGQEMERANVLLNRRPQYQGDEHSDRDGKDRVGEDCDDSTVGDAKDSDYEEGDDATEEGGKEFDGKDGDDDSDKHGKDIDCRHSDDCSDEDGKDSDWKHGNNGSDEDWKENDDGTDEEGKDSDGENSETVDDGDEEGEFLHPLVEVEAEDDSCQLEGVFRWESSIASFDTEAGQEQATMHAAERNLCMWDSGWFVNGSCTESGGPYPNCNLNGHWDRCTKRWYSS